MQTLIWNNLTQEEKRQALARPAQKVGESIETSPWQQTRHRPLRFRVANGRMQSGMRLGFIRSSVD